MLIKQNRRGVNTRAKVERIALYAPSATLPEGKAHWACYSRGGVGTDSRSETKQTSTTLNTTSEPLLTNTVRSSRWLWEELTWTACSVDSCALTKNQMLAQRRKTMKQRSKKISAFISKKWLIYCWDEFPSIHIHSHFYFVLHSGWEKYFSTQTLYKFRGQVMYQVFRNSTEEFRCEILKTLTWLTIQHSELNHGFPLGNRDIRKNKHTKKPTEKCM